MKKSAPLIAGIDFSPSSPSVLQHALHASASSGAPVIALHVLDTARLGDVAGPQEIEAIKEDARSKLQSWLAAQTTDSPEMEIRCGSPAKKIYK
jgi:nucleotide-binding universal stress UspA family protein